MKARLLVLSALTIMTITPAMSYEAIWTDTGRAPASLEVKEAMTEDVLQQNAKIVYLTRLLEQQQSLYEKKISYLEYELKKSKERLVEKSLHHEMTQDYLETKFGEETTYLKRELVAKTKTMLEYQRQLEKIKPSEDFKNLIKVNTELAIEVRKSSDQLALIQLKHEEEKGSTSRGRMPASAEK